jgi:hypothetical protein
LLVSSEEASAYLAKKFGVPDNLIRDSHERQALAQAMQQMAAQQQGMAPPTQG